MKVKAPRSTLLILFVGCLAAVFLFSAVLPVLADEINSTTAADSWWPLDDWETPAASPDAQNGSDDGTGTEDGSGGSGLPDEVNRIFVGLGLFAAMMAVMAVGTEVVVDMFRVLIGMKRKVTALEAYARLEKQLPGQLAELGVGTAEIEDFKAFTAAMHSSIIDLSAKVEAIKNGRIGEIARNAILDALQNLVQDVLNQGKLDEAARQFIKQQIDSIITELKSDNTLNIHDRLHGLQQELLDKADQAGRTAIKADIQKFVDRTLLQTIKDQATSLCQKASRSITEISEQLSLPTAVKETLSAAFEKVISDFEAEIKDLDFDKIYDVIQQTFNQGSAKILAGWLESQTANLTTGPETIKAAFDENVKGFLLNELGLDEQFVNEWQEKLDEKLANLSIVINAKTGQHLEGAKELLNAVESRRQKMGSPLRKALRAIRETSFPILILALGILIPLLLTWVIQSLSLAIVLLIGILAAALIGSALMRYTEAQSLVVIKDLEIPEINKIPEIDETITRRLLKYYKDQDWLIIILGLVTGGMVTATAPHFGISRWWALLPLFLILIALLIYMFRYKNNDPLSKQDNKQLEKVYTALKAYKNETPLESVAQNANVTTGTIYKWTFLAGRRSGQDGALRFVLFSIGDFFFQLETLLNYVTLRDNSRGQIPANVQNKIDMLKTSNLAAVLQERDDQHRDEEATRLRWLRIISAAIGIVLAVYLHIDAAILLDEAISGISEKINVFFIVINEARTWNPGTWFTFLNTLPTPEPQFFVTPGSLLTGLAASAGSAFWHDVLDRLQASKKGAEAAAKLLEKVQKDASE